MVHHLTADLVALLGVVRRYHPLTRDDIKRIVDDYFNSEVWSILKEEYDRMSDSQKEGLYNRILSDVAKKKPQSIHVEKVYVDCPKCSVNLPLRRDGKIPIHSQGKETISPIDPVPCEGSDRDF